MTALIGHRPSLSLILPGSLPRPFIILKVSISAVADIINQPSSGEQRGRGGKQRGGGGGGKKEHDGAGTPKLLIMPGLI